MGFAPADIDAEGDGVKTAQKIVSLKLLQPWLRRTSPRCVRDDGGTKASRAKRIKDIERIVAQMGASEDRRKKRPTTSIHHRLAGGGGGGEQGSNTFFQGTDRKLRRLGIQLQTAAKKTLLIIDIKSQGFRNGKKGLAENRREVGSVIVVDESISQVEQNRLNFGAKVKRHIPNAGERILVIGSGLDKPQIGIDTAGGSHLLERIENHVAISKTAGDLNRFDCKPSSHAGLSRSPTHEETLHLACLAPEGSHPDTPDNMVVTTRKNKGARWGPIHLRKSIKLFGKPLETEIDAEPFGIFTKEFAGDGELGGRCYFGEVDHGERKTGTFGDS